MHQLLTGPLTVERLQIEIADLPKSLSGLTLVQLSDFHFDGMRLSERLLADTIAASNAIKPDLVLLTGDFVTDAPEAIYNLAPWLQTLQSRYGTYAVLGNHDNQHRRSRQLVTQALQDAGMHVLWNQVAYPVGPQLPIVGLADFWSADYEPAPVMQHLDQQTPRIVLSHNPDSADSLQHWRVDLLLCGHTHGGQVVIPRLGTVSQHISTCYSRLPRPAKRWVPWMKECHSVVRHWERSQGLHQIGDIQLYVNRGLGTYLPGRFFCTPEVTVITLV